MEKSLCSWIIRTDIVKIVIPLKAIYRFNTICYKNPKQFFTEIEMSSVIFILKMITKIIINYKWKAEGITNFKLCYRGIVEKNNMVSA